MDKGHDYGEWRAVPGIEASHAQVSSKGWMRTRTLGGKIRTLGKPSQGQKTARGDRRIHIGKKCYLVHRLVALAFLGPPSNPKDTVDHIDTDPSNNSVNNLRWATRSVQRLNQGKRIVNRTAKAVCVTDSTGNETIYRSILEAGKAIGAASPNISRAIHSKGKVVGCTVKFAPPEPQEDLEGEIWTFAYCDPSYMVSTFGRIQRRDDSGNGWQFKYTPTPIKSRAYVIVRFKNGAELLHRVIKISFHGFDADPSKSYVDHVNRNCADNRLSNLEWATASTNMKNRVLPPKGYRC